MITDEDNGDQKVMEDKNNTKEIDCDVHQDGQKLMVREENEEELNLELLYSKGENSRGEKIPVHWSSFIKVKKKNYLEDYVHIREIG